MKTCEEATVALVEMMFGELDDVTEMGLNQHLLGCGACRAEEQRLLDLRDRVRGSRVEPEADLRARIRAALPRQVPAVATWLGRPVPAYAAIVAAMLGALFVVAMPLLRAAAPAPRAENRSPGVPINQGWMVFTVAGPYETRVSPASDVTPDSSRLPERLRRDSL